MTGIAHAWGRCPALLLPTLIHYEFDPSALRTLQRNGRVRCVRRVGPWAADRRPTQYSYPTFRGTRDDKAFGIMRRRMNAFGLVLGGVLSLDDESETASKVSRRPYSTRGQGAQAA